MARQKRLKPRKVDTIIGPNTELLGDIRFSGELVVEGTVRGNVVAEDNSNSLLALSDNGTIEGEIRVPNVILNGMVVGDVHASDQVELASKARVTGNVYYNVIQLAMGAEVNGSLVHGVDEYEPALQLGHDAGFGVREDN
ncbi:MAG: polymer-forming cytoskeletal protein [Gammaproteobacteria bacterium]|nr:polymer-forming cytoskeletal protein [Gammaproteobacteria bacterium]